jgi:hypothetical protein
MKSVNEMLISNPPINSKNWIDFLQEFETVNEHEMNTNSQQWVTLMNIPSRIKDGSNHELRAEREKQF